MRLGRFDPLAFKIHAALGYGHFLSTRYDDAVASAERAMNSRPQYLTAMRLAAAAHALAGRLTQANALGLQVQQLDPHLRLAKLPGLIPFQRPADMQRWSDALGKAGLPE
jgi:hypothetical protein